MSAFLGPIHYWLYNKIKFQDELTNSMIRMAEQYGGEVELQKQLDLTCGTLEHGDLADIIQEDNIHVWLQERISVVEKRLSYIVTTITNGNPDRMHDINSTAYNFGQFRALECTFGKGCF